MQSPSRLYRRRSRWTSSMRMHTFWWSTSQRDGRPPGSWQPGRNLVNALLWHCKGSLSGIGGEIRPGIVHRIDKDTSGLLVVAKDDATHIGLSQQMAVHSVERAYNTIVYGGFAQDEGFVESNLGRSKTDRKKMAVYPASEPHTKYAYTATRCWNGWASSRCWSAA